MTRVAMVHSFYSGAQPSGENMVVESQLAALRDAGHTVELFSRATDDAQEEFAYRARSAGRVVTGRGIGLLRQVEEFGADVVHVHNLFPNLASRWLVSVSGALVVTVHNYRFVCAAGSLFRDGHECHECLSTPVVPAIAHGCYRGRLASVPNALAAMPRFGATARLLDQAEALICLNPYAERLLSVRVHRPDVIHEVPNFVDVPVQSARFDSTSNVDGVVVGRLDDQKGILWLLRSWPDSLTLTIIGDGPQRADVERMAAMKPNVRFLGQIDRSEIFRHLSSARVLVIPSLGAEGIPTVALEGLAAGVPIAMSSHVAVAETFARRGVAEVFRPDDGGSALSAAVLSAIHKGPVLSEPGKEYFAERYSRGAWLRSISDVYESAITRRRIRASSR